MIHSAESDWTALAVSPLSFQGTDGAVILAVSRPTASLLTSIRSRACKPSFCCPKGPEGGKEEKKQKGPLHCACGSVGFLEHFFFFFLPEARHHSHFRVDG